MTDAREELVGWCSLWSLFCTFSLLFFPKSGRGQTPEGRHLPQQEARRRGEECFSSSKCHVSPSPHVCSLPPQGNPHPSPHCLASRKKRRV